MIFNTSSPESPTHGTATTRPPCALARRISTRVALRLLAVAVMAVPAALALAREDPTRMRVHAIDVGQGSATLLEFSCGADLIDAGAGDAAGLARLQTYLARFFRLRPDLHDTLRTVFLTHCHKDHALGLEAVARRYTIEHFVDDGIRTGSGRAYLNRFLVLAGTPPSPTHLRPVGDAEVRAVPTHAGLTDGDIDALSAPGCDPDVRVLEGGLAERPEGWSKGDFENLNNQSLVIRASLGKASVLVTGDLETDGVRRLTDFYAGTGALAAEVLVAGHHGSANAITPALMGAVSPEVGLISCGRWTDGKDGKDRFTTWWYGHPSKDAVSLLASGLTRRRDPVTVKVGVGGRRFEDLTVDRAVYSTGWDGSVVVDAYADGRIEVKPGGLLPRRAAASPDPQAKARGGAKAGATARSAVPVGSRGARA